MNKRLPDMAFELVVRHADESTIKWLSTNVKIHAAALAVGALALYLSYKEFRSDLDQMQQELNALKDGKGEEDES